MNKRLFFFFLILVIFFSLFIVGERPVNAGSLDFHLVKSVLSSGGGNVISDGYSITNTLGQPVSGTTSTGDYQIGSGFWAKYVESIIDFLEIFLPLLVK